MEGRQGNLRAAVCKQDFEKERKSYFVLGLNLRRPTMVWRTAKPSRQGSTVVTGEDPRHGVQEAVQWRGC